MESEGANLLAELAPLCLRGIKPFLRESFILAQDVCALTLLLELLAERVMLPLQN